MINKYVIKITVMENNHYQACLLSISIESKGMLMVGAWGVTAIAVDMTR